MTTISTLVIIEAPTFVATSPETLTVYQFIDSDALFEHVGIFNIPSLKSVQITPAIISLGQDLGQRASVTATFKDHKHIFADEDYDSGTFWGKWRARYGQTLRGLRMFVSYSKPDVAEQPETRTFLIESSDGPSTNGEYKIIAKDVLKLADGDRAQAPVMSNGFLASDISDVATSMSLSPSGIGDDEYPAMNSPDNGFYVNVGGNEIIQVYRSGDTLNVIARGVFNTTAAAHTAQDRVQLVLTYTAASPDDIIADLLINYADVDASYINTTNWSAEVVTYLNTVYSAVIAEPTDVNKLIAELIEQAGLVLWWDDVGSQVRLQVLRSIATTADTFTADTYMADSLEVNEQPDKRISQVYTYFGKINPTVKEDQINNYRSTAFAEDAAATTAYGSAAIKKIFSRWIADGGRTVADTLNEILLARFATPPRRISFDLFRGSVSAPQLGVGYQIEGWPFQDETGAAETVPVQITRLKPKADAYEVECEEMIFTGVPITSPDAHMIIIDANIFDVNLRTMHDSIFSAAVSGTTVTCTILSGITVGSTHTAVPALTIGTWTAGVTINLIVDGRIQGKGGAGGDGAFAIFSPPGPGLPGLAGGTALYTRTAINLSGASGEIWGGGGGGGGSGGFSDLSETAVGGAGGGGGSGTNSGNGGFGGGGTTAGGMNGNAGTATAGGVGGTIVTGGGAGGAPGDPGTSGGASTSAGGAGGAAGTAIDGNSLVTGTVGDIQGATIN